MTNQAAPDRKHKKFFGPFPQQPRVTPAEARRHRRSRKIPADSVVITAPTSGVQFSAMDGGNPIEVPSISELARALRYNVDLIYQYVHDNVDFIPTYGLHKGGLGALVDGSGNPFDQCDLMVQLLAASGYTAQYVLGNVRLTSAQWSSMLGVDATQWTLAVQMLNNGGIGVHGIIGTDIIFEHCWVKVNIDGTNYYFDPSLKDHTVTTGVDLATALGYSQSTFLTRAKTGATIDPGNSVESINAANINADLATFSMNLVAWIKQNNPGATFEQIVGGRTINPTVGIIRNTTLPYQDSVEMETSSIPDEDKCWFRFQYDFNSSTGTYGVDVSSYTDVLYGYRFTLWWNGSGQASVYFNGNQYGLSVAKTQGAMEDAVLTVIHPYASNFADTVALQPIQGRAPAYIGTCFGMSSKHLAAVHHQNQNQHIANGETASSEPLLGTSLGLIWDNFIGQSSDSVDILKRLGNCEVVLHHFVGIVAQNRKPPFPSTTQIKGVSSFMSQWGTTARASGVDVTPTNFALSTFVQALEGTASEQVTGVECGDAIKVISICNQSGVKIFDARKLDPVNPNWTTGIDVKSQLAASGYNATVLQEIEDWLDSGADWRAIIPNDPTVQIGSFSDFYGYIAAQGASTYSMTWFGAKGAASASGQDDAGTNNAAQDNARQVNGFGMPSVTASETARVDMLTGRYELSSTDLTVGNQGAPYELAFVRSYNSSMRLAFQDMGFGWGHNWQMKAAENSEGFIPFGDQQVSAAAPTIATLFVMRDVALSNTAMPIENFVIECEIGRFMINQLSKNVVRLSMGGNSAMFTKMPDGSYLPARGMHGKSKLEKKTTPTVHFEYTTPDGILYKFRNDGKIENIIYPFGITITFTYNATSGKLTNVTNGFRNLNFTYDTYGQLKTINDGNGRTVTLTIDLNTGNLASVKDPLNNSTVYEYDQRGRMTKAFKPANPTSPIFTNIYDTLSRVKEQEDAHGNVWQYFIAGTRSEEVAPNNTSRAVYFNGNGSVIRTNNALGETIITAYDGNERAVLTTFPEGNTVATTYDADGNATAVTQNPKPGSGFAARSTTRTYESVWNKVATLTDHAGNAFQYEYQAPGTNGASRQKKITAPTVAAGTAITQLEYNNKGQLTRTTDPTGLVTDYSYDPANNNLLSIAINPSQLNIVTSFTYDSVGNAVTTTNPLNQVTTVAYDALRRETQVTSAAPFNQVATATYDANGNVIETQTLAATDANAQTTQSTYAVDGKLLATTGPVNYADGAQAVPTRFEYDSLRRLVRVTDATGRVTSSVYDALGRPQSSAVNGVTQETIAYTLNGLVQSVTDARSKTTAYEYDGFDRGIKATYPDASYESVVYDTRNNVLQARTRAGLVFDFVYDALNQMVSRTPSGQPAVSFTYDLAGRPLTVSVPTIPGDLSTGTFTMLYDTAKRPTGEQYPDGKTVTTNLDKNGRPSSITYPDLSQVTYTFDQLDRLSSISGFGGNVTFAYDSASRRVQQINGNQTGQASAFDKGNSLLAMTIGNLKPSPYTASPRIDFAYQYSDTADGVNRRSSDSSFNWEPSLMKTTTYGAANNVNQYPSVDGVNFTYNTNGCLTSDGVNSYGYDFENKLTSVTTSSGTVQLKYDPLGRLTHKTIGSNSVRYLYAGTRRIEEYDNAGALARRYVYGGGLDECLFVIDVPSGTITYLHSDELGSPILRTDGTGTPVGKNVFTPWGELASGSLSNIQIGFTGQFYDNDTGLYFFKSRHYSPKLGRFLQPDTIGYAGGLNLYAYCSNDPVNNIDPLGLQAADQAGQQSKTMPPLAATVTETDVYDPVGAMEVLLAGNQANVTALNSGNGGSFFGGGGGGYSIAQLHAINIMKTNAAIAALHAAWEAARLAAVAAAQAQAALAAKQAAALRAHVMEYISQGAEVFRAFSSGYGPDRFDLMSTVDFSKPQNMIAVGLGGAAYGLTEVYGASKAGLFGGTASKAGVVKGIHAEKWPNIGNWTDFSHWVPRDILKNKLGGPDVKTIWNGNVVNKAFHAMTDPVAYKSMPKYWKLSHDLWGPWARTFARVPLVYYGIGIARGYQYQVVGY